MTTSPVFQFEENDLIGNVFYVDTNKLHLNVASSALPLARVGRLVGVKVTGAVEEWTIAVVERVVKNARENYISGLTSEEDQDKQENETITATSPLYENISNIVTLSAIATYKVRKGNERHFFSRSVQTIPDIDAEAYCIEKDNLERFMALLTTKAETEHALTIGKYTISEKAKAQLDGNRFFQRHAAILGSTGSGKSWTVASILEKAAELPSSNLLVFDLHGEYKTLAFARHLKIAGPDDLDRNDESLLYLPYWLLNSDEMQAMFVEKSEFTAQNQAMMMQKLITEAKLEVLEQNGQERIIKAFTIDSPVPYNLDEVTRKLEYFNTEKVQGARGIKNGDYYGQFSRLLARLGVKKNDKRYGFLFQYPAELRTHQAMHQIIRQVMDFSGNTSGIKVIDFSEVPSEILPVIIGLVARIIYNVQFWTKAEQRQPLAMVCDEAHLYLPRKSETNPNERRALENFEKIAKEGRKYGVSLLVVSQRPSDVSETILSQCNNIMALRLSNRQDQNTVKAFMPESLEFFTDVLPSLDIGETVVMGDSVLLPTRIKLDPPREENRPLSQTVDFWSEWAVDNKQTDFEKAVENYRRQSRN
ncbi:MAG: ATP-binding protein [Carboxylicivirga sp.]|jgi:hypothetical protein|nr:ATP-binding protein [Carboxylicivirga sp.]